MHQLPIFIRLSLVFCLLLTLSSIDVLCQVYEGPKEKSFHKDSNTQLIRRITSTSELEKKPLMGTSLRTGYNFTTNISDKNSATTQTFRINGAINVTVTTVGSTCGYINGSIIASASGGTAPYTYDIGDGWKYNTGNFPRVARGAYTLIVTDAAGQTASVPLTVGNTYPKVSLKAASYKRVSQCDVADASVTLQASGGVPPYEYSMDGINYQSSNVFSNFYPGVYDFFVRDANGCVGSFNAIDLGEFANYNTCNATALGYPTAVCGNEGEIDITGYGPNKPYTYSIDGVNYQSVGAFSNLGAGIYTVRLKDATGALQILVVPIHQSCYIKITYISVDAACGQNDGTLTVSASNGTAPYSYSIDGINYQSSNEFTGLAPGAYFITVRDANGFLNSMHAVVYDRCPTVSATVTDESCAKNDGSITAVPNKGTSPYQYSIDGVHFQNSTDFASLPSGSYTLTLRDANGFKTTASAVIKNACLQVSAQTTNSKCGGSNGAISVTASNGTAPYQYSLDGTNFQPSNTFSNLKAATYTLTVKDWFGKTGSTIVNVFDTPAPSVTATSGFASCSNNDGSITVTGIGGTLPFTFSIDGTGFQQANVFTGLKSGAYTAYIKDANQCLSSLPIVVPVDCPLISAVASDETCGSKNGSISLSSSGGTAPYQYSIDGLTFNSNPGFASLPAGNYTITVKDAMGIANRTEVSIRNICPNVVATVTDGKCTANGGIITAQGNSGFPPYQYSIDGLNFQTSGVFSGLESGKYTITLIDSHALINTTSALVQNFPSPKISTLVSTASCLNNDGQITINNSGGSSPFQYSVDGISFQSGNVFRNLSVGTYPTSIKDANGCTDSQNAVLALSNNLILQPNKQLEICEGNSGKLNIISNASSYSWSPQKSIDNASLQNPSVSPLQNTMYFVNASLGICSKEDSVMILVDGAPTAVVQPDTVLCYGQSVTLHGSGGLYYYWTPVTYLDNSSSSNPVVVSPKSSISYSLKVVDSKGCSSLNPASVKVSVTPPSKLFAGNDTSIVMNQPFQLLAQDVNKSGFANYTWSPRDGLNNPFIANPITTLDHNTTYAVVASTPAGCIGTDEINVTVYKGPEIFVPNAFSPNGDGLNDILKPILVGIKEFKSFVVYNRYGEKVFYTSEKNRGWDGNLKGQQQKADSFVWFAEGVDDKGNIITRKGSVLLLR